MPPHRPVLVTGAAGFIGYHVARRLLAEHRPVVGLDNLNSYYDVSLKRARLAQLKSHQLFRFVERDLESPELRALIDDVRPDIVVHLAAQVGVRYSLENPQAYISSNIVGFANLLEALRGSTARHLLYASSSSVYGSNASVPFSEDDRVDHPVSLYAATKKSNELMAHAHSHLFGLPTTGLRFFTVYGPWGRPDMAVWLFTRAIMAGEEIDVFAQGELTRDFTYVDDAVEAIRRLMDRIPTGSAEAGSVAPFQIVNIGNDQPVRVADLIGIIEREVGRPARKRLLPMQPGDVARTWADMRRLRREIDFAPSTPLADGIRSFVRWYKDHHAAADRA